MVNQEIPVNSNESDEDDDEEINEEEYQANVNNIIKKSSTKTLQERGFVNIYVRKDLVPYFARFKILLEREADEIFKIMNRGQQTKKAKRSGVLSLGISKLVKNHIVYMASHRSEKLLTLEDFLSDGRKDNIS